MLKAFRIVLIVLCVLGLTGRALACGGSALDSIGSLTAEAGMGAALGGLAQTVIGLSLVGASGLAGAGIGTAATTVAGVLAFTAISVAGVLVGAAVAGLGVAMLAGQLGG